MIRFGIVCVCISFLSGLVCLYEPLKLESLPIVQELEVFPYRRIVSTPEKSSLIEDAVLQGLPPNVHIGQFLVEDELWWVNGRNNVPSVAQYMDEDVTVYFCFNVGQVVLKFICALRDDYADLILRLYLSLSDPA